jgi:phage shock protein C
MKKLYLSQKDKKIAGVAGGIGESYDVDPTLIRLILVLIALATAIIPVVITYFIAWLIIPKKSE